MKTDIEDRELCAYYVRKKGDEYCNSCNGYPENGCLRYTTISHLEEFEEIFEVKNERQK